MIIGTFQIHNREALRAEQALLPFARYVSRVLTSSGVVREISLAQRPPRDGWIVFQGEGERGFAVRGDDLTASLSPLQRSLERVRRAQAIVQGFGGPRAFPFTLSLRPEPPESWRVCKVVGVVSTVWCSSSLPVLEPPARSVEEVWNPVARTKLYGMLDNVGGIAPGERVVIEELRVEVPELGIVGRCYVRGGAMTIEVLEKENAFEQRVPGVRLDLGEIEVRVTDLVGLRPGAVLDLGSASLERCYMRLGSTILAEGRFERSEGKLTLTIESVV